MSKKSNKKSPKKKTSPKGSNRTKKKIIKKKSSKPAKKAKAKKQAPKKKVVAKKNIKVAPKGAKKILKPAKKVAPKKIIPKAKVKPAEVKKVIPAKPVAAPKVVAKPTEKVVKATEVKAAAQTAKAPVKKVVKASAPKNIIPIPPKKSVIIDIKTGPEPAGRFELEYVVHSSAPILFEFLTSPSGLSEWFCDDVNIRNGIYSFKWEENEQQARVVKLIEEKLVRFQWIDKHDNSYFEFRIERDDLTNDISLIVADFAETDEERTSSTLLWNSQIAKLLHQLGSYF